MGQYDATIGTLMVGIFFNTFLYGLVMYQFVTYHWMKVNDRPAIKYMVFFLFMLDTSHSASAIYMAWYYTVTNYDNPTALAVGIWPYIFTPASTALSAFVTQIYLGIRIWRFTNSNILYGVVILLAVPSFILGIICSVEAYIITFVPELPRITPLVIAWLSMQVVVDMFITVTLIIVFTHSRTGTRKTDTVLNRLIRGAILTGLFPGIFSLGDLVTFVVLPNTNLYGMFSIPLGRIYTKTLMDSLLTRESLKAKIFSPDESSSIEQTPEESSRATPVIQGIQLDQLTVQGSIQETCDRSSFECVGVKLLPLSV